VHVFGHVDRQQRRRSDVTRLVEVLLDQFAPVLSETWPVDGKHEHRLDSTVRHFARSLTGEKKSLQIALLATVVGQLLEFVVQVLIVEVASGERHFVVQIQRLVLGQSNAIDGHHASSSLTKTFSY
jgi:hypothetical protein